MLPMADFRSRAESRRSIVILCAMPFGLWCVKNKFLKASGRNSLLSYFANIPAAKRLSRLAGMDHAAVGRYHRWMYPLPSCTRADGPPYFLMIQSTKAASTRSDPVNSQTRVWARSRH